MPTLEAHNPDDTPNPGQASLPEAQAQLDQGLKGRFIDFQARQYEALSSQEGPILIAAPIYPIAHEIAKNVMGRLKAAIDGRRNK